MPASVVLILAAFLIESLRLDHPASALVLTFCAILQLTVTVWQFVMSSICLLLLLQLLQLLELFWQTRSQDSQVQSTAIAIGDIWKKLAIG